MAHVMTLLEMALFLWLVSDTSSSLGREGGGGGFPPLPMLVKADAWFLKRAVAWEIREIPCLNCSPELC